MVEPAPKTHEQFMQRCLYLGARGLGNVAPNPLVGCVITLDDKIIGEGYHQKFGGAHAEVNAINSVADQSLLAKSTLYVSLEPCSHFGKTPPCADLIVSKKIPRVVIANTDPNPQVAGKGIQKLKDAGIEVLTGVLEKEAAFLNRRFLTFHTKHRPYIILKWAQSSDGLMGLNEPKQFWFSNAGSTKLMHKWRTEEAGILVGINTVVVDDPELTARHWPGNNPVRIVIDPKLELPRSKKIFNNKAPTMVFNTEREGTEGNIRHIKIDPTLPLLPQVLTALYKQQIQSVTIEGGPSTLNRFISAGYWDEARVFTTPHRLQNGKAAPTLQLSPAEETSIDTDTLNIYYNRS